MKSNQIKGVQAIKPSLRTSLDARTPQGAKLDGGFMFKNISFGNKKLNWWQILLVIGSFVAFFLLLAYIIPSSSPNSIEKTQQILKSPSNELLFEIHLTIAGLIKSGKLTEQESRELSEITLITQDVWNKELGYYVYLSPPQYQKLSNSQMTAVLSAIRHFRESRSNKRFDVMIFDDPSIAKTARTSLGKYDELPEAIWCEQIFVHYRGAYSWNPTNQYEQMNLNIDCNWKSLLKK